ncbi:MAG: hypothetical protein M0Z28_20545 [Rhodospirillales bacterium]|nr:hypothetical protein [Rhodospirillales bacterium]
MQHPGPIVDPLTMQLGTELGDPVLARELALILTEDTLLWRAPELPPGRAHAIFGFTFGNRMLANGNRVPGPVNEALADQVCRLHQQTAAPVFAQWEIAEALAGRVPPASLTAIYPGRDARGEPVYLGTGQVVAEFAARTGVPDDLGPVLVVAFSDHLHRAVTTARRAGFDAHAPAGLAMPAAYDPDSGQAWCRSRLAYLLHDIMIRISERRAAVVGSPWR